jgi:CubicO group peptidase (beta-lactamase class C family)
MSRWRSLFVIVPLTIVVSGCTPSRQAAPGLSATEWPVSGWRTGAPEEKGFDSFKLAEGLLAIRRNGLDLHSVSIVRDGVMVLAAYFYPYDGETVHDQASVTKSIMTAIDRRRPGKLRLDDPMLLFFPAAPSRTDAAKSASPCAIWRLCPQD